MLVYFLLIIRTWATLKFVEIVGRNYLKIILWSLALVVPAAVPVAVAVKFVSSIS